MASVDRLVTDKRKRARAMLREAGFSPRLIGEDFVGLLVSIQMEAHFECVKLVNELVQDRMKRLDSMIEELRNREGETK